MVGKLVLQLPLLVRPGNMLSVPSALCRPPPPGRSPAHSACLGNSSYANPPSPRNASAHSIFEAAITTLRDYPPSFPLPGRILRCAESGPRDRDRDREAWPHAHAGIPPFSPESFSSVEKAIHGPFPEALRASALLKDVRLTSAFFFFFECSNSSVIDVHKDFRGLRETLCRVFFCPEG